MREKPLSCKENPERFGKNLFTMACGVVGHICVLQFYDHFLFLGCLLFGPYGTCGRYSRTDLFPEDPPMPVEVCGRLCVFGQPLF